MDVISHFAARYERTREEEYSLEEYLELCKRDKLAYATAAERMLQAIGEPQMVDTRHDPRLSRIFANKVIKLYPAFEEFYGMEDAIEQVVSYFRHAAQGLEERKQILYLLGPVGGGKSSIAERLKQLAEHVPFFALKGSPVNESPLGLFDAAEDGPILEQEYGIPRRYLQRVLSPWAVKRLEEFGGDIRQFRVVKRYPSILKQVGIAKTEPGDENNQDISSLVGKVDIRKLETYAQDDPDAYSYSGGLCLANQGLLEFVEMFKAPIKVLHPLLTATQEGNFKGTEGFGAIPFDGVVLAHSNESEWRALLAGPEESSRSVADGKGETHIVSRSAVEPRDSKLRTPWHVVASQPVSAALAPVRQLERSLLVWGGATTLLLGLAGFAVSRYLSRRVTGLRADGQVLDLEASISQISFRGHKLLTAILRDVTERVRAERALTQYQLELSELTQRLLEQEAKVIGPADFFREVIFFNDVFSRIACAIALTCNEIADKSLQFFTVVSFVRLQRSVEIVGLGLRHQFF